MAPTGGSRGRDGVITVDVNGPTDYTTPLALPARRLPLPDAVPDRGTSVDVDAVSVHFTAAPTMADPSDYANYFYSSDDLLNRIWYARRLHRPDEHDQPDARAARGPRRTRSGATPASSASATRILTDGAKRDRTVWPGDLGISFPTAYASTGDTVSTRNALTTMYDHQCANGALPYSGPPLSKSGSDTYHLWTLSATGDYYDVTADKAWLDTRVEPLQASDDFILAKMDAQGLLYMTTTLDSSDPVAKGERLSANVLMWKALDGRRRARDRRGRQRARRPTTRRARRR